MLDRQEAPIDLVQLLGEIRKELRKLRSPPPAAVCGVWYTCPMPGHHHVPTRIKGVVAACFAMTGVLTLHATADDFTETATRHLMQSVESQPDGTHLARLSSLRLLRDPAMKDLFYKLLQHEDWLVQVHALLGLAEIEDGVPT